MLVFRAIIAIGLIIVGIYVIARMAAFPFAQTFTGWILGIAMILLGIVRLRQVRAVWGNK